MAQRNLVPKVGFRLEIDGLDDVRAKTIGALEVTLGVIKHREGGQPGVVQQTTTNFNVSDVEVVRDLDLDDRRVAQWFANSRSSPTDERNGTVFLVRAGEDVAKRDLRGIVIMKHSDVDGDAEAEEDAMEEKFTLSIRELGDLEVL